MRVAVVWFETAHHRKTETNARLRGVVDLLRDGGHDVHVCCARFWSEERRRIERDGVVYHAVASDLDSPRAFSLRLPFVLRAISPDVIHAAAEPTAGVLAADVGSTFARAPVVVEWYGDGGIPDDRRRRRATARGDRIVAPSRLVRTWIQERGASGDRIEVIPTHVDAERIRETAPAEETDVVYARRLDEGANVESLLLGLAELRDREWTATVVGDGPERGTYEGLAGDLRIDDRVTFVGERSLEERIAIYRGAHVFVQTARQCVFPTELLWALASGCVGVVEYHADSSAHELVEGRERGFRTTSDEELADAIVEAGRLERRDYDDRFEAFDRRPIRERYLETYRSVLETSGIG